MKKRNRYALSAFTMFTLTNFFLSDLNAQTTNTAWPAPSSSAFVGIGTNAPTTKLSIVGDQNEGIDIRNGNVGASTISLLGAGGHDWRFWSSGSGNTGGAGNFQLLDMTYGRMGFFVSANTGYFGLGNIGALNLPTAQLHTTGTVRFQGIATDNTFNETVVIDANGNLAKRAYNVGTSLSCGTANFVPKVSGANALGCSQIFDNGTSIGIGTTSPVAKLSILSAAANDGMEIKNSGTSASTLSLTGGGPGTHEWRFWSSGSGNSGGPGNFQLLDQTGARMGFFVSGATGYFGLGNIGALNLPTAQLHTTGTVRFQGIATDNTFNEVVVIDANGNLAKRTYSAGASLSCTTVNYLPKVSGTNTMGCSQIFDNGTSVGIGTNTGFTYTGGGAVITSGGGGIPVGTTIALKVNGLTSATSYVATSDKRFKKDIKSIENAMDLVNKLQGVSYKWRSSEFKERSFGSEGQIGFIAQDVEKIIPEAVIKDENGYYGINYNMIIPVLAEALKGQAAKMQEQQSHITELESIVSAMKSNISTGVMEEKNNTDYKLEQNVPNPFSESTSINYSLPVNAGQASIIICDLSGKLVKKIDLQQKGQGTVSINSNELNNGILIYALVINGKEVVSKKMVVTQ